MSAPVFESSLNFRDIGGRPSVDGRMIATGVLYRSSSLANLTPGDVACLTGLGIRTVIDLRRAEEVTNYGRIAEMDGRVYHNISPEHDRWEDPPYDDAAGPARYLADRYVELARDGRAQYAKALRLIAVPDAAPAVVHCFAGKDRTGVLVALILALLGVADEEVAAEYAMSDAWSRLTAPPELPMHWIVAPADAITLFLADVRAAYGSIEGYMIAAGLDTTEITALRTAFLHG